eukprot:jgi/Tetstr1/465177/TSEL_000849.t1
MGVGVGVDAGVAANVSTSDGVGRLSSELLELCGVTFRFSELHNLDPIAKDSLHLTSARRGLMQRQRRL